jgi:hypothetical protein
MVPMNLDPVVLSSITAAITIVSQEYAKGIGSEAGKATWAEIKSLFGWNSDPSPAEIPNKVAEGLASFPKITKELLELLKQKATEPAAMLVQNLTAPHGESFYSVDCSRLAHPHQHSRVFFLSIEARFDW